MVNDSAMMDYEMYPQLLMDGLQRKDPVVRDWVVRRYRTWAVREARRQGVRQEAEDIAHEALLAMLERPPIAAIERGVPMRAILCVKIYDRVCITLLKKGRFASLASSLVHEGPGVETGYNDYDKYQRVRKAMARLSTRDRELIEERYLGGKKATDMADEDRSPAAVRGGVFRALEHLREATRLAS